MYSTLRLQFFLLHVIDFLSRRVNGINELFKILVQWYTRGSAKEIAPPALTNLEIWRNG